MCAFSKRIWCASVIHFSYIHSYIHMNTNTHTPTFGMVCCYVLIVVQVRIERVEIPYDCCIPRVIDIQSWIRANSIVITTPSSTFKWQIQNCGCSRKNCPNRHLILVALSSKQIYFVYNSIYQQQLIAQNSAQKKTKPKKNTVENSLNNQIKEMYFF